MRGYFDSSASVVNERIVRRFNFHPALCTTALRRRTLCKNGYLLYVKTGAGHLHGHLLLRSPLASVSSTSSSTSAGLKYSATTAFSSCSRSGFSMNLTVPSRPRSPVLPLEPFVRLRADGDALLGDSLGEGLVPFGALVAPFVVAL